MVQARMLWMHSRIDKTEAKDCPIIELDSGIKTSTYLKWAGGQSKALLEAVDLCHKEILINMQVVVCTTLPH